MATEQKKETVDKRNKLKVYAEQTKKGVQGMANTDRLARSAESTGLVLSAVSKFASVDGMSDLDAALTITSGVLDVMTAVSAFMPPPVSVVMPIVSGIFSMFLPGPPPAPSMADIKRLFTEQQTFINKEKKKQNDFITEEFEKFTQELMDFNEDLFSKEFLRETKTDALALLDQIKEQYDYILPQANVILTEAEALDLDQHVSSMASTFHSARAKHAFTDRCPDAFLENDNTDDAVNTRKLCALLLETYFSIEKFRDITLTQLIIILESSPLKNLVSGYLMILDDRKTAMEKFVSNYLINKESPEDIALFCPLFQPCGISYSGYCPWSSDSQRQGIVDYLTFISPETIDVWSNIYHLCNIRTFGCSDNANCQVSIQFYVEGQDLDISWPYGASWDITFVGDNEVTITPKQENLAITKTDGGPDMGSLANLEVDSTTSGITYTIKDFLVNGYTDWWGAYEFADFMDDCYSGNKGL